MALWTVALFCWKASLSVSTSHKVTKPDARICALYISEFTMTEKKMGSIIILAQPGHPTPTSVSGNGNSYNILELSAKSDTFDIM